MPEVLSQRVGARRAAQPRLLSTERTVDNWLSTSEQGHSEQPLMTLSSPDSTDGRSCAAYPPAMPVFNSDAFTAERRGHLGVREALARCSKAVSDGDVDLMAVGCIETVAWIAAWTSWRTIR